MDLRALLMGLAFAVMWASAFTSTRMIVTEAPPLMALALRFALSGVVGVMIALAMGQTWRTLRHELDRLHLVALVFPTFRDGRAYSQARLLRERHGYDGELRATGQVLRDQFVFMLRAGFDAFEVKKDSDAEAFGETAQRYSVFYQPAGDGHMSALNRRLQLRHSESAGQ